MRVETDGVSQGVGWLVRRRRPDAKLAGGGRGLRCRRRRGLRRRSRRGGPQREPLDKIHGERVEEGDGVDLRPPPHEHTGEAPIGDLRVCPLRRRRPLPIERLGVGAAHAYPPRGHRGSVPRPRLEAILVGPFGLLHGRDHRTRVGGPGLLA